MKTVAREAGIPKILWSFIGALSLASIVLVSQYAPYVPSYDGLSYFAMAKTVNGWLFGALNGQMLVYGNGAHFWPIANAVSVFLAALFMRVVDINILPTLINTLYLALFAAYLVRIRPAGYVFVAVLLLCANTLFFRLFTTLTSEFSVGLWLFAFLATLLSSHANRGIYLSILTIVGLLLRTVDIVFILAATAAYAGLHYAFLRDVRHLWGTLRSVGLTVLITMPLFWDHYRVAYKYVYTASFGVSAESWKAMAGVSDRPDVLMRYGEYLYHYNPTLLPVTALMVAAALFSRALGRSAVILPLAVAIAVCLPLMAASSLNIMVVYWVFSVLVFTGCEVGAVIIARVSPFMRTPGWVVKSLMVLALFYGAILWGISWSGEVPYLRNMRESSDLASKIARVLDKTHGDIIMARNYNGISQLDELGLAFNRPYQFRYGGVQDIYSRGREASEYLKFKEDLSFFITAHENYGFPAHFGINDHVAEIHGLMVARSGDLGFRKVAEVADEGKRFDIWYRPAAHIQLQYANHGDHWISRSVPITIGNEGSCEGQEFGGRLRFTLDFPKPAGAPEFEPPFKVSLLSETTGEIHASTFVGAHGRALVAFEVNNLQCGTYLLSFDKSFSTMQDKRKLSARYIGHASALRFEPKGNAK